MVDYKPNSHRSKENPKDTSNDRKKLEKVVTGTVKTKKKGEIRKFTDVFISEDVSNVKNYILMDVLIPAVKKGLYDIVTNGLDMFLYGESRRGSNRSHADRISYTDYSRRGSSRPVDNYRSRSGYSYDDIILESRGEAEEVLTRMDELVEQYGVVSVADLYDLVGKSCEYTDNKYGWTNIRNAEPIRVRDGYMLKLPKALPID